jgi:putative chitinase
LKEWVEEEARSARIYRRVAETAVLEAEGGASLWRDPDLQIALTWREKAKANKVWAQRYHCDFDVAMSFLDRSVDARDREIREKEKDLQRRKSMKRTRWTAVVFGFLFLLSMAALVVANQQRRRANAQFALANEQRSRANSLLESVRQSEKEAREAEEKARLARDNADQLRKAAEKFAQQADALRKVANEAQKKALNQKDIAEQQASRVAELERKARKDADEEREINSLTRELKDQLGGTEKTEVVNIASKLSNHYKDKQDARGEFENQTILGSAYLQLQKSTEAREAATRALRILEENKIDNEKNRHENLTVLRDAYTQQADTVGGYTRSSEENQRRDELRRELLLNAFNNGSEALDVQKRLSGESSGLIPDLTSLALVSEKRGELAEAEGYREKIVEVQQKTSERVNAELVTYLSELARFNQSQGDYAKAEDRFKAALAIQESFLDAKDPQLVVTLNSLAAVYRAEKKDTDADRIVQRIQQLQGSGALLRKGASGPEVRKLQLQLQKLGLLDGTIDGTFGPRTEFAVIAFQRSQGLQADGVVGPGTIERLEQPQGPPVRMMEVQTQLKTLGFYTGPLDGSFGIRTQAALKAFQRSKELIEDGTANPETLAALGFARQPRSTSITGKVTVEIVAKMFPNIPVDNIKTNLPVILRALEDAGISDKDMVLMAVATIGIDTAGTFAPTVERKSRFNTSADGYPFDLYDNQKGLGNQGPPDGERFKGRGYVQLTGRAHYKRLGAAIGLGDQLVENPDLASDPTVAAKVFVQYIHDFEHQLRSALTAGDLTRVRRTWSGGSSQLDQFTKAFQTGASLIQ